MTQLYLTRAGPGAAAVRRRRSTSGLTRRPCRSRRRASLAADLYKRLGPYRTLGWAEATWPAQRESHGRSRRSWTICIARSTTARRSSSTARPRRLGHGRRRDRVDRSRAAHDVSAARHDASDVRRRAGGQVRGLDPARVPARRSVRRPGARHRAARHARSSSSRTTASTRGARPSTSTRGSSTTAIWCCRARPQATRSSTTCSAQRRVLRERGLEPYARLRHGPRPDLLQPARPRGQGHRRARAGVRAAGRRNQRSKLLTDLNDPETGQRIVRAVYKRDDVYTGEFIGNAADLQIGFEDGYRVSWQTTLGVAAGGHRLSQQDEVERRPRRVRLQDDRRRADLEPAARPGRGQHHGHRADRPQVLRRADPRDHRRQSAVQELTCQRLAGRS